MDIVEFAEKFYGMKFYDCQKQMLRELEKLGPEVNIRVVTGRFKHPYIYPTQAILKELIQNGQASNRCDQMSVMR